MKRYLSFIACAVIFLSVTFPSFAQVAQSMPATVNENAIEVISAPADSTGKPAVEPIEYIIEDKTNPGFIGQDHFYTVTFRGNGEAVVNAKIIFTNLTDAAMETITLTLPKVTPQNLAVYQVQREKECIRYIPSPRVLDTDVTESSGVARIPEDLVINRCAEYAEPNYYNYYYGKASYQEAQTSIQGDKVTITLAKPVATDASGSIMLYYRANGYTTKTWSGAYAYNFETAKVNETIRTLQVGINTDNDLYLSNTDSEVNYMGRSDMAMMATTASAPRALENAQFDNFYQQIGYGQVNKTSSNLQPEESYTVTGEYAKNRMQLYAGYILGAIVILIVFIIGLVFGIKTIIKKLQAPAPTSIEKNKFSTRNVLMTVGIGFGVAVLLALNTLLGAGLFAWLTSGYYYSSYMPVIMIMIILILGSVDMLLLVVPAVVIGFRKGVWLGVLNVVSTVVWMILFASILLIAVFLLGITQNVRPMPFMMDAGVMKAEPMMTAPAAPAAEPAMDAPTLQVAPDVMEWTPATSTETVEIDLQK